jgi:hypothetical protein
MKGMNGIEILHPFHPLHPCYKKTQLAIADAALAQRAGRKTRNK